MIVLAVLVTFATAAFTFGMGVIVALVAMALFKANRKTTSPIKCWGIGSLSVAAMTNALVMRSHSGWGYAAGAAELCELIFGVVAVLLLVLIGLGQAGLTRLFGRRRASMPTATAAGANAPTPTSDPRHE